MLNGRLGFEFQGCQLSKNTVLKSIGPSTFIYDRPNLILTVFSNVEMKISLKFGILKNQIAEKEKFDQIRLWNLTESR